MASDKRFVFQVSCSNLCLEFLSRVRLKRTSSSSERLRDSASVMAICYCPSSLLFLCLCWFGSNEGEDIMGVFPMRFWVCISGED